jgi:hypothetical protein
VHQHQPQAVQAYSAVVHQHQVLLVEHLNQRSRLLEVAVLDYLPEHLSRHLQQAYSAHLLSLPQRQVHKLHLYLVELLNQHLLQDNQQQAYSAHLLSLPQRQVHKLHLH